MEYQGYRAAVVFDDDAELFHGEVVGTRDVITFQGTSVPELREAFAASVDEYLQVCAERGRTPDRAYSGQHPAASRTGTSIAPPPRPRGPRARVSTPG